MKSNYIFSIICVSNKFNIPLDISKYIYYIFKNCSSQIIISKWFNYIYFHSTYLCESINNLPVSYNVNKYNQRIFYYDLNNYRILHTFFLCSRLFKPNISDHSWWSKIWKRVLNGFYFLDNNTCYDILYNKIFRILTIIDK